ncbi:MAG: aminoacetone oxidase family FAD-binding enzyme [Oscillospiraceae bacterium]|nr:aminoacetone oxidase family FAD-binding enzyme [Oscillospiraceae bacterium]
MNVMIIGGGASGMMAALTAAQNKENHVLLLERQSRMGRKLLATGNGRCNLSNENLSPEHYHGETPDFCTYALRYFDTARTLDFFRSLGLLTVTEPGGRIYPASDSANSVADVLRLHLEQAENVTIETGCEITALRRRKGVFCAEAEDRSFEAERVILCAGGAAGGKLGGTELGYKLLRSFGHSRTKLYPALVQLRTDTTYVRSLKGVRCQALVRAGRHEALGELQFTDYGVSGPVIFDLSRRISTGEAAPSLLLDLLPQTEEAALLDLLRARCRTMPGLKAEDLLTGVLHNRLGHTLLRSCACSLETPCGSFDDPTLARIARAVKAFPLEVTGVLGMEGAQVTAGGIRTAEFDPETMESRLCPGLYAAGEVLDIDGDCGGYNLQWAWASGRLAGELRGKA